MHRILFGKMLAIGITSCVIVIALWMIERQIAERRGTQLSVMQDIAQSAAEPQTLIGPVLAIRYQRETERKLPGTDGRTVIDVSNHVKMFPVSRLSTKGTADVETRQRGIFRAQLYNANLTIDGELKLPRQLQVDGKPMLRPRALLVMSVTDLRGLGNVPEVTIGGRKHAFQVGDKNEDCPASCMGGKRLYVDLGPIDADTPPTMAFSLPLQLSGTQRLAIAPVADNNQVSLQSSWPHPSFSGRFLPRQRQVSESGFNASWQISHLSRSFDEALYANQDGSNREHLQVQLMDPVNVYTLATRAIKYGILFVVLTFGAFFVTESLRRSPIHPIQYLLVGLALAIFFLLLIALSEHFDFALSYLVSALACIGLIAYYMTGVLGSRSHGLAFGAGLTGLYGLLFGILHSEDNALLIGAVLLFVALGSVMLGTRRIDWYRLNAAQGEEA